jgi:hypothetical protein
VSDAAVEYLDVEDLVDLARLLLGNPPPIRDIGLLGSAAALRFCSPSSRTIR